ncbi:hypothetical protein ACWT_4457 [Actinoplanes sp. SE50]|uniref:DUF4279 domain-containing protein n=1 Tax=unclassified Actinoplanes TaxID=2626549 RepID=UPI00023ECD0C|nr:MULTISPECIES: DUF4279 domain-containing protein [unclassified Actinoplanes]AEV85479.1 hypothetical protein ACPL_4588 [Actinoplanes sp. SE50/110]ATO83872.1 hypothetical protein ACWT_4457 [Actinoplanes sp. SE50]SLM01282.1 hypothetical protein ACSP50_4518 [Actinoplanes sp. SE50/110]
MTSAYVCFALISASVPAARMTARLGVEPDEVRVRGSEQTAPMVVPVAHSWEVHCRKPDLTVDEQIGLIVDRLSDHAARIGDLAAELAERDGDEGGSLLQVVRCVTGGDPLGWHLDARLLEFLRLTRAELDVDES